jgi:hypothetical protein
MRDMALKAEIRSRLPYCPGMYVDEIADRLTTRTIPAALLPQEITRMAEAVIRHQLTDYDSLRTTHALSVDEARLIVESEVADWLSAWRCKPDKQHQR